MNIAVFGANGPTGRLLTKQALAEGHAVTAVTRHPETFPLRHDRLRVVPGDVFDLAAVARFLLGTRRFWPEDARPELAEVNGQPAVIVRSAGHAFSILTAEVDDGHMRTLRIIANPDKLARVKVARTSPPSPLPRGEG